MKNIALLSLLALVACAQEQPPVASVEPVGAPEKVIPYEKPEWLVKLDKETQEDNAFVRLWTARLYCQDEHDKRKAAMLLSAPGRSINASKKKMRRKSRRRGSAKKPK